MRMMVMTALVLIVLMQVLPAMARDGQLQVASRPAVVAAQVVASNADKVIVKGTVPSEAARAAIVKRLRQLYGAAAVIDHLDVGGVYAPPEWAGYVARLLTPSLQYIANGALHVEGNTVRLSGRVDNEALRQKVLSMAATQLNPTYTIRSALKVTGQTTQQRLDSVLGDQTITFESGSTVITRQGLQLLDEIAAILRDAPPIRLLVAGHTDNVGSRRANVLLSIQRATAVKNYLVVHGVDAATLSVMGYGPDRPVASNKTAAGRAKNRRIEFVVEG